MTILVADLLTRLQADAPAVSGVPSTAQYTQAIKDAIADLSRQASVPRVATLSIVSGTASYDLPGDFQEIIRLSAIGVPYPARTPLGLPFAGYRGYGAYADYGATYVTAGGLVPFTDAYREEVTVAGGQLTIYPTPTASAERTLVYAAGDALNDAGDGYDTLTEDRAAVALLHARAACIERLASGGQGDAVRVKTALGQEIDTSRRGQALRDQAAALRQQYADAVRALVGTPGGLRV